MTRLGSPHHGALDPIVASGDIADVAAKFTYGPTSKDLEDEQVIVFEAGSTVAGDCPKWRRTGYSVTDEDGALTIGLEDMHKPGRYPFEIVVAGDGTSAHGAAWVLEAGARVVVFDIDGTLTEGDEAIVEQVLSGVSPQPRSGSAAVARKLAKGGAQIVYITGRPLVLANLTRAWLSDHGFPPGPVRTTTTSQQAMPSEQGVQQFKLRVLQDLLRLGVVIERAYGNAVTDICAYAQAPIAPENTFIVGRHGGEACGDAAPSQAVRSYDEHLATIPDPT